MLGFEINLIKLVVLIKRMSNSSLYNLMQFCLRFSIIYSWHHPVFVTHLQFTKFLYNFGRVSYGFIPFQLN